ncbi:hypothetical protein QP741_23890, partial [Bacillus subtilis]|nr:hypothetical protein [Bacillus subtilis]
MYDDVEEGGFYELDEGNFKTTSYPDTAGPVFNGINSNSKRVNLYDSVNVIVNAYDDYSEIKRVSVQYKIPQGGYVSFEGTNIGSNQFKLQN